MIHILVKQQFNGSLFSYWFLNFMEFEIKKCSEFFITNDPRMIKCVNLNVQKITNQIIS